MPTQTIHPDLTAAILAAWADEDYPDIWPLTLHPDAPKPLIIRSAEDLQRQTIGAERMVVNLNE
jgi:hypothetical protein